MLRRPLFHLAFLTALSSLVLTSLAHAKGKAYHFIDFRFEGPLVQTLTFKGLSKMEWVEARSGQQSVTEFTVKHRDPMKRLLPPKDIQYLNSLIPTRPGSVSERLVKGTIYELDLYENVSLIEEEPDYQHITMTILIGETSSQNLYLFLLEPSRPIRYSKLIGVQSPKNLCASMLISPTPSKLQNRLPN